MTTLKLGIIGSGFVAHFHARALTQVRTVDVDGITSITPDTAKTLSEFVLENGLGKGVIYPSITEMCNHVDAVAIFAPNFARIEIMGRDRNGRERWRDA